MDYTTTSRPKENYINIIRKKKKLDQHKTALNLDV